MEIQNTNTTSTQTQQGNKPMTITIILPTNAYFISGIRDFTLNLIKNITEFNEQWAFRFQSIVDELCNNAIEYGSSTGENITLKFINNSKKSIEIIVEDTGTGKNKTTAEELTALVKERSNPNYIHTGIRGRGLSKIVAQWTDELTFQNTETGGIKVHIKKYLQDPKIKQEMSKLMDSNNHLVIN